MLVVRNWLEHFENHRTRELKSMDWLPLPTDISDMGYVELIDHPNGPSHFACWIVILQIAATCTPRGSLVRGADMPLDATALARAARIPVATMQEAIDRLLSPQVGWLEEVTDAATTRAKAATKPRQSRDNPAASRDMPPEKRDDTAKKPRHSTGQDKTVEESTEQDKTTLAASPQGIPDGASTKAPDEVWDCVVKEFFGGAITNVHRGQANKAVADLKTLGATPSQIRQRIKNYRVHFPSATCTCTALVKHWHTVAGEPSLPGEKPYPSADEIDRLLTEGYAQDNGGRR